MKNISMKGKSVDAAVNSALEVLGGKREEAVIKIVSEGRPAMLGVIGGEDAEVEVTIKEGVAVDAKQVLQEILDKMAFVAVVDIKSEQDGVELAVRGEDMGRIIGKNGATLRAFEILVGSMLSKIYGEKTMVNIDAGEYKEKRKQSLERLAAEVAEEVAQGGREKALPQLDAADRRIIHMFLKDNPRVTSYSSGEGRDRRLVVAPRG